MLLIWSGAILGLLMISEFLSLLTQQAKSAPLELKIAYLLLGLPFLGICVYPFFYAKQLCSLMFRCFFADKLTARSFISEFSALLCVMFGFTVLYSVFLNLQPENIAKGLIALFVVVDAVGCWLSLTSQKKTNKVKNDAVWYRIHILILIFLSSIWLYQLQLWSFFCLLGIIQIIKTMDYFETKKLIIYPRFFFGLLMIICAGYELKELWFLSILMSAFFIALHSLSWKYLKDHNTNLNFGIKLHGGLMGLKALTSLILTIILLAPFVYELSGFLISKQSLFFQNPNITLDSIKDLKPFWFGYLMLALIGLSYLEYEWIIRPLGQKNYHENAGPNSSEFPPADLTQENKSSQRKSINQLSELEREILQCTGFLLIFKTWLPVLIIHVNLGFENLEYRKVIHTMLLGLREAYHKTFLAWNSGLATLGRVILAFFLLFLVNTISQHPEKKRIQEILPQPVMNILKLELFALTQAPASAPQAPASAPQSSSLKASSNDEPPKLILQWFFPKKEGVVIHFQLYHLLLLGLFYLAWRGFIRRWSILPYHSIQAHLERAIDGLSSRLKEESSWSLNAFKYGEQKKLSKESDFFDPRIVEMELISLLQEFQKADLQILHNPHHRITLPKPEITFVFDELDKLGTKRTWDTLSESNKRSQKKNESQQAIEEESTRSMEVHQLLANMKNLLSSSSARFIFVGGRDLHDEWLADQSARRPLLTSIFNAEIYIPSLLTDHHVRLNIPFDRRIENYMDVQRTRAFRRYQKWQEKSNLPWFSLMMEYLQTERFWPRPEEKKTRGASQLEAASPKEFWIALLFPQTRESRRELTIHQPSKEGITQPTGWSDDFCRDFLQFLTYRSLGIPKRLKELLESFVRPV